MIDRIRKGRNAGRLLDYLFGPGKSDEHENAHLVAGWRDELGSLEPTAKPDGRRDVRRLAALLNVPLTVAGRRGQDGTVWHCVLSAAPADRLLTDVEWKAIAVEFMDRMGLACREDPAGVRWVAVRHGLSQGGIDHIHIAATLARQDGRLPSVHNDFVRARRACLAIEGEFGLTVTAPADRTAAVRPTRAETEMAARTGKTETPRVVLRRLVQEAAAAARGEAEFFARVRDGGALVRERRSVRDPGRITGYAVALPDHTARDGGPVWFGGGKLAPDLTWPQLIRRWEHSGNDLRDGALGTGRSLTRLGLSDQDRQAAWAEVINLTARGAHLVGGLAGADPLAVADAATATADALRLSARVIRGAAGRDVRKAADEFDRAAREAYGVIPRPRPPGDALRTANRLLYAFGSAGTVGGDLAGLLVSLAELVAAAGELRQFQGRAYQAAAAARAVAHLNRTLALRPVSVARAQALPDGRRPGDGPRGDFPRLAHPRPPEPRTSARRPGRSPQRTGRPRGPAP